MYIGTSVNLGRDVQMSSATFNSCRKLLISQLFYLGDCVTKTLQCLALVVPSRTLQQEGETIVIKLGQAMMITSQSQFIFMINECRLSGR